MNQPDRYSKFILPDDAIKVTFDCDTKLEHAGTYTFLQEDHTIGNLLRMQLHDDKSIVFAGYRIPHPLETKLKVRVQTNGTKSPEEAMRHALEDLNAEFNTILNQFNDEARDKSHDMNTYN